MILPNLKVMHKKRHFHLEMLLDLIVVNFTFNPNIQTNNWVQKQTFNPKFLDKKP